MYIKGKWVDVASVIVLEERINFSTQEVQTRIHSAMIRPSKEAIDLALQFIKNPPEEKEEEGYFYRYPVEIHGPDGGVMLTFRG